MVSIFWGMAPLPMHPIPAVVTSAGEFFFIDLFRLSALCLACIWPVTPVSFYASYTWVCEGGESLFFQTGRNPLDVGVQKMDRRVCSPSRFGALQPRNRRPGFSAGALLSAPRPRAEQRGPPCGGLRETAAQAPAGARHLYLRGIT